MDAVAVMAHTLEGKIGKAYTTDYVILETTLLLKSRLGAEAVEAMVDFLNRSGISILVVDEPILGKAIGLLILFYQRVRHGIGLLLGRGWWTGRDLNPGPPRCQRGDLPG